MIDFDPRKSAANLRKHGIALPECEPVFGDPWSITLEDRSEGERRFNTLGMDALGRLLIVTWTGRSQRIRIISARKASPGERRNYHGERA